jgi:phosphoribosylaminoimidazole-succinocarboxamide synthase
MLKDYPDPNVTWGKKYKVIPIEMIVRGYITGVTNTSLWHNYSNGQRDFGIFTLPEGLKKNQKLPEPVLRLLQSSKSMTARSHRRKQLKKD